MIRIIVQMAIRYVEEALKVINPSQVEDKARTWTTQQEQE